MNYSRRALSLDIARKFAIPQLQAHAIVTEAFGLLSKHLAAGDSLEFRTFGMFDVVVRKPRPGRNPLDPTRTIPIPAHSDVRFRPSKDLLKRLPKVAQPAASAPASKPKAKAKAAPKAKASAAPKANAAPKTDKTKKTVKE